MKFNELCYDRHNVFFFATAMQFYLAPFLFVMLCMKLFNDMVMTHEKVYCIVLHVLVAECIYGNPTHVTVSHNSFSTNNDLLLKFS